MESAGLRNSGRELQTVATATQKALSPSFVLVRETTYSVVSAERRRYRQEFWFVSVTASPRTLANEYFEHQQSQLELDAVVDRQPVELLQRQADVIGIAEFAGLENDGVEQEEIYILHTMKWTQTNVYDT